MRVIALAVYDMDLVPMQSNHRFALKGKKFISGALIIWMYM